MNNTSPQLPLLEAVCRKGVLVATSVRYWRGCKRLNPEDIGLARLRLRQKHHFALCRGFQ